MEYSRTNIASTTLNFLLFELTEFASVKKRIISF